MKLWALIQIIDKIVMKKQEKQRFEYIDEFRKISTLQKLPTLTNKLQNMFEDDVEKDNNNYMRFRKEPIVDRWDNPEHQNAILSNQCVEERVDNLLNEQKEKYEIEDARVRNHIRMFKQWSQTNKNTKPKNESFKFFYKNASPPKKTSQLDNFSKGDKQLKNKSQMDGMKSNQQKQGNDLDIFNLGNQKLKYDFKLINQKRMDDFLDKPDKQKNSQADKEEDVFFLTFRKYEKFKTLEEISAMDQLKMTEQDFFYDLNNKEQSNHGLDKYFLNKFIYKSVTKSLKNTEKDVQYFRDLGLPSRSLEKYTESMGDLKNGKQPIEEDTKEQAHFLHLLRESELNINKNEINFDDVSNISNGRITCLNAYMCIRSQKVTKAQFEKLLKKLDKYKKQQMEKGKQKLEIGVCTEDIDMQFNMQEKVMVKQQKNSIIQLINQISEIRQAATTLKPKKPNDGFNIKQVSFNREKFLRMETLLKRLYDKIVTDSIKFPFSFLEDNLHKIDDMLQDQYKDGKLLWFILDCYEEIIKNLPDQDNIKSVTKKKPINEPKVCHYKGNKLIKEEKVKVTNLYTYRDRSISPIQVPTNDRSKVKSKNSTTPNKTERKKPIYTNTYNFTYRKL